MKKMKVMTIVGTRPEIIRLSRVISVLNEYCDHILVHTGQNYDYELNQVFFDDLDIKRPDFFLDSAKNNSNFSKTIGNVISNVDNILMNIMPEAVLILGDTNSCLSVIPAKRRKIPTFHMEAGNRCFDQRVPEEINRRIIDHTADVNLTYSSIAREYLLREGLPPDQIIKTGSPMYEVLQYNLSKIKKSSILSDLKVKKKNYFVVSTHREENIDVNENFNQIVKIINFIAEKYKLPVLISTHPRTRNKINQTNAKFHSLVHLLKPLGFFDYIKLQMNAKVVLSDSGTINEEASILNFPALNMRETHERPEAMEEIPVMMTGLNIDRIIQCLSILEKQVRINHIDARMVSDYKVSNVSHKIVKIIHSYTDYINRVVWKKF